MFDYQAHQAATDKAAARAWKFLYIYRVRRQITSERFVQLMSIIPWTYGEYDPTGGDGYISGAWDIVTRAVGCGEITDEEYASIIEGVESHAKELGAQTETQ